MKHQSRPDSPADHHSAGENLGTRKQAHIDICTDPALPVEGGRSMFDQVRFLHRSLPELDAGSLDSSSDFLGYRLSAPILISCMTGGSDEGYRLNRILAEAAGKLGFAVGTGSLRILLRKPEVTDHFRLKDLAPDVPVLGNIGAVQLPELFAEGAGELDRFLKILQDLSLDALVVHLNPGQELFQTHGDRDFSGLLDYIRLLAERSPCRLSPRKPAPGSAHLKPRPCSGPVCATWTSPAPAAPTGCPSKRSGKLPTGSKANWASSGSGACPAQWPWPPPPDAAPG
jgi:hypothetical protein